MSMRDAES